MITRNLTLDPEMQPTPRDLIQMVKYSMRCFGFGLASAMPVIGLPIAFAFASYDSTIVHTADFVFTVLLSLASFGLSITAAWSHQRARTFARGHWNPAKGQLLWGEILSSLGVLLSLVTMIFLAAILMGLVSFGKNGQ